MERGDDDWNGAYLHKSPLRKACRRERRMRDRPETYWTGGPGGSGRKSNETIPVIGEKLQELWLDNTIDKRSIVFVSSLEASPARYSLTTILLPSLSADPSAVVVSEGEGLNPAPTHLLADAPFAHNLPGWTVTRLRTISSNPRRARLALCTART